MLAQEIQHLGRDFTKGFGTVKLALNCEHARGRHRHAKMGDGFSMVDIEGWQLLRLECHHWAKTRRLSGGRHLEEGLIDGEIASFPTQNEQLVGTTTTEGINLTFHQFFRITLLHIWVLSYLRGRCIV